LRYKFSFEEKIKFFLHELCTENLISELRDMIVINDDSLVTLFENTFLNR
jgi:hypothetical protein